VRFKVIDFINAAKMAKYSLIMTPTPCKVVGCILLGIRIRWCIYLFTYLHSWFGTYKTGSISEIVKGKQKLLLTAYIMSYTGF